MNTRKSMTLKASAGILLTFLPLFNSPTMSVSVKCERDRKKERNKKGFSRWDDEFQLEMASKL